MDNRVKRRNPFGTFKSISTPKGEVGFFSLPELERQNVGPVSRLPYTIKVLLESALRNVDGLNFTEEHVKALANWRPNAKDRVEIPFKPARVILQDFTGVPAVVDLAAMRDAMTRLGGNPKRINPLIPCDLVIDHSIQVDRAGTADSLSFNEKIEFERNRERYELLKWSQTAFNNFRVVPPSTGIVHQVNLEHLSCVVFRDSASGLVYPDSCVGTDSHTTMVNGLAVLAWGVGGIEAEAVMLDQPIYMLIPEVVGFKLTGKLPEGTTATDLVLCITEICRKAGVVGKFVEFYGPGISNLSLADRATIGNMAPEQGSTVSFFPCDKETLSYLELSGRGGDHAALVETYCKEQGLFRSEENNIEFSSCLELDLSSVEPSLAGPKRPHDRVRLSDLGPTYKKVLTSDVGPKGFGLSEEQSSASATISYADGTTEQISHGAVLIAAITSCTNTSNPAVMLGAGLLAKKAVELGLRVPRYVKASLAPGSRVVTDYLNKAGLLPFLEKLGFYVVGYGCTTCIGNSGPLADEVVDAVEKADLVTSAVLSGNRNFEGRVHKVTRSNYLASPPLVVAFALAGSTSVDITKEPIGLSKSGAPVYLKDIWPTNKELQETIEQACDAKMFAERYEDVWSGSDDWKEVEAPTGELFVWDEKSTYVQSPPFFDNISKESGSIKPIHSASVLGFFADSVTTDHISPAGGIAAKSPAASFLRENGVADKDFNSYGARRGNHLVMMRGTFANIRLRNLLTPDAVGNVTVYHPTNERMSFFEASQRYIENGTALVLLAGKEYGSGSSRDWAAKGPFLLGVKAVIAESYERIHRSNLIGMGIVPLQFKEGESGQTLGLTGQEQFDIEIDNNLKPGQAVRVTAKGDGYIKNIEVICRVDTPVEVEYIREGGILSYVLKSFAVGQ